MNRRANQFCQPHSKYLSISLWRPGKRWKKCGNKNNNWTQLWLKWK